MPPSQYADREHQAERPGVGPREPEVRPPASHVEQNLDECDRVAQAVPPEVHAVHGAEHRIDPVDVGSEHRPAASIPGLDYSGSMVSQADKGATISPRWFDPSIGR